MDDSTQPYIKHNPGDLITAEDWNSIQIKTRADIAAQVATAVANVKHVEQSDNSDHLDHKSIDDLTQYILDKVLAQIPKRTGYMRIFCNLHTGSDKIIQHKLGQPPLVDLYQLDYFLGVCAKSDKSEDTHIEWVLFYLYHADEKRLRVPGVDGAIDIEGNPKTRILWKKLIDELAEQKLLSYTDDTTLDDLETDFWQALFKDPNDDFDPDSYCHSPWFEKCCGEKRTVGDLTKHGDFDDIYLKMVPQKTSLLGQKDPQFAEPTNVQVTQLDYDSVNLRLLDQVVYNVTPPQNLTGHVLQLPQDYQSHLPLMVLLKV